MTKSEIILRLKSDSLFALSFAIDNNPTGLLSALNAAGIVKPAGVDTKTWLRTTLLQMLGTNKAKAIELITSVQYVKDAPNWTGGFIDYFMDTQPSTTVTAAQRFSLDALLGGLGAGLSTYAGISTAGQAPMDTAQAQAAQAEAEAKAKAEEDRKKRTQKIIIFSVIGVVVLGVIVYFITKKKKTTE